jgi:hypothetical protein
VVELALLLLELEPLVPEPARPLEPVPRRALARQPAPRARPFPMSLTAVARWR